MKINLTSYIKKNQVWFQYRNIDSAVLCSKVLKEDKKTLHNLTADFSEYFLSVHLWSQKECCTKLNPADFSFAKLRLRVFDL